ncbi:hypothetical protein ASC90_25030 [Rhizobium sp. Root1220]|nr:hypothetical protein ASC90_25030 [Rhizobium sp. Root1220]
MHDLQLPRRFQSEKAACCAIAATIAAGFRIVASSMISSRSATSEVTVFSVLFAACALSSTTLLAT